MTNAKIGFQLVGDQMQFQCEGPHGSTSLSIPLHAAVALAVGLLQIATNVSLQDGTGSDISHQQIFGRNLEFRHSSHPVVLFQQDESNFELAFQILPYLTMRFGISAEEASILAHNITKLLTNPEWRGYTGNKH